MSGNADPKLFQHCEKVYAELVLRGEQDPEHDNMYVFTGSLTKVFDELGLGQPYYTSVMARLKAMQCVRQLQRGGGPQPSKWLCVGKPTLDGYEAAAGRAGRGASAEVEKLLQQNRDLTQRLSRMEGIASRSADAIALLTNKVNSLSDEVQALRARSNQHG